jgi:outer membrane protein OmpA-like peptidoglycan-associated protein
MTSMSSRFVFAGMSVCVLIACRSGDARTRASSGKPIDAQSRSGAPDAPAPKLPPTDAPLVPADTVRLVHGLTLVSVYKVPEGERENTVVVNDVSAEGVEYGWSYRERREGSAEVTEDSFTRFVSAADLAGAPRLNGVFRRGGERDETPGYTAMSLSRAVYGRLRSEGATQFTTMGQSDSGSALDLTTPVPYKGTLSVASAELEPMAILLNGRRVSVPTLHVHGRFTYQTRDAGLDFWALADSTDPLILRSASTTGKLFQMIRIDLPARAAVESDLEHECRAELPGIYFAFGSAELQPASEPALDGVASLLSRHPDWSLVVEGHTDSVGDAESNRRLSHARADAVRAALLERHGVPDARLRADGFSATRPRETNATLEGRARNRRVELVRTCDASK